MGLRNPTTPDEIANTSRSPEWTDEQIVQACLVGDECGWERLIHKYQKLICSFPRRYGAQGEDAADVYQLVCLEVFLGLPRLRDRQALRAWVAKIAKHQAYHWKRRQVRRIHCEGQDQGEATAPSADMPSTLLENRARIHGIKQALARLSPRNRELVRLMFFEDPPASYETVAKRLGLAVGSIAPTRNRCLQKIAASLAEKAS